jgi:hypothetical protein
MRTLIGVALGAAAGYALARAVEARAHGLPITEALVNWRDPVATLKLDWVSRQPLSVSNDPDAPMPPSFRQLAEFSNEDEED